MRFFLRTVCSAYCALMRPLDGGIRSAPVVRTALDVGCGEGRSTIDLWKKHPDHVVLGIDRDATKIRRARMKYPNVLFRTADLMDLTSGGFDIIQMRNVIHDVDDLEGAIARISHLLRPNGLFILSEEDTRDVHTLSRYYRSCSTSMGWCRQCIINDDRAEFIFQKSWT